MNNSQLTPLMRQYWDIKSIHDDKILLFRMGDFYEMFFTDATTAAPILGIALTSRNKKSQDETPMCGMPYHSVAGPINKLLKHGLKVAICDQIEDPKLAKGLVKRAVTRILTPGMVYDSDTLESTQAHYLACWEDGVLACLDPTTGEAFLLPGVDLEQKQRLWSVLPIAEEVLASEENPAENKVLRSPQSFLSPRSVHVNLVDESHPSLRNLMTLADKISLQAARRLLSYVESAGSAESLKTLQPFTCREIQGCMDLNAITLRHLELFQNSRGESSGTLFAVINRTQTSSGARLLRSRLSFPLTSQKQIESRLQQVQRWTQDIVGTQKVREQLRHMGDIERRLGKIAQPQCNGRDLRALAESTLAGDRALKMANLGNSANPFTQIENLSHELLHTLLEELPLSTQQGFLIQKGISSVLDELIMLSTDSQALLQAMENREREKTGISSLKIRYNNVFGYYIEITHTHKEKVPDHYLRKQTLANAERYCTDELIELERKVLSAQSRRFELEAEIFAELRSRVLAQASVFLSLAAAAADLDFYTAAAWLAMEKKYVRPQFTEGPLHLIHSRHPVVEQTVKAAFTANSLTLQPSGCLLLTGPNMAGKSTLMRQVALISILAQSGLFVPAESAVLPIFNHLFTRIGASDQLSEGLSTFMVEMIETSEMLKKASGKSLLILDEIGRGTSTFDGMSLAQAILEYIVTDLKAMTLFATHYHELTGLSASFPQLKNAHMKVAEKNGEVQFLHTLSEGPAQKSYGIHVAKIAGLPASVTQRAEKLLHEHENKYEHELAEVREEPPANLQLSLLDVISEEEPARVLARELVQEIRSLQVMNLTPLQALQKMAGWQERLQMKDELPN